jgi:hypothetical protein
MEKTRIYVPISIGELIDKLTILEIKLQHIFDDTKYRNIQNEHMLLLNVAYNYKLSLDETPLSSWKQELRTVNLNIWNAEEQLKNMSVDDEKYAQVSHISHSNNYQRFIIKQQINSYFMSDIQEEKSYL